MHGFITLSDATSYNNEFYSIYPNGKGYVHIFHIWIVCYTIDAIHASILFNGVKLTCVLCVGLWSIVSINFAECQYFIPHDIVMTVLVLYVLTSFEPRHDKTNKETVRPATT